VNARVTGRRPQATGSSGDVVVDAAENLHRRAVPDRRTSARATDDRVIAMRPAASSSLIIRLDSAEADLAQDLVVRNAFATSAVSFSAVRTSSNACVCRRCRTRSDGVSLVFMPGSSFSLAAARSAQSVPSAGGIACPTPASCTLVACSSQGSRYAVFGLYRCFESPLRDPLLLRMNRSVMDTCSGANCSAAALR
jgi:hypothetical protein